MKIVKCEPKHLKFMISQDTIFGIKNYAKEKSMEEACKSLFAYTILLEDTPLLCAGVHEYWAGRGEAWALFNENCKPHFMTLHNIVKKFLDLCPLRRIEAAVEKDFEAGHRWVKTLGFQKEADVLKSYTPTGKDCSLYARTR